MPPPRLYCLLAAEAPIGVVIRRGPSQVVRLYSWDRDRNTFKRFDKIAGRIDPLRSDISPDGAHLLYFVVGRWKGEFGSWTALGKVGRRNPQTVWGLQDTWGGGGFFVNNREYWLYESPASELVPRKKASTLTRYQGPQPPLPAHAGHQEEMDCNRDWVGWDRNRKVWTQEGKLFCEAKLIYDFNEVE